MAKGPAENLVSERAERRKILVVGTEFLFTEYIMNYSIELAERLGYDILALNVDTEFSSSPQGTTFKESFRRRADDSAGQFKRKATNRGIHCEHAVQHGSLGKAVEEVLHRNKRIEFVVTESEDNKEEVTREVSIPVFSVVPDHLEEKGENIMAKTKSFREKKHLGQTIIYGAMTVALYAAVFLNAGAVMKWFTKWGVYAALPIATVFVFSFAHGNFASHLWSLLGVEAMKKETVQKTQRKEIRPKKRATKKPRVYAYVNPFHRM